jgi:hypothetical protein
MLLYNSALNKAKSLKQGDMVSWNSSGGRASGKVVRVVDSGSIDVPNTKFKIKGEKDNPAVLIQLYRDGKETDIQVGHKMSSLTKSINEQLLKHGSHNQKTHAGSRGGGFSSAGAAPTSMPFRPTGKDKLDEALFNRLDRRESNAAYVNGWKQGQAQSKDDKLFNAANSWIDMTDKAINEGKMPSDGFLLETARAVGLINGMLQSQREWVQQF